MKLEDLLVPLISIGIVAVFVGAFLWMMRNTTKKTKKVGEVPYHLRHKQDLKH
jgi:hypothetical protein